MYLPTIQWRNKAWDKNQLMSQVLEQVMVVTRDSTVYLKKKKIKNG